MSYAWAMYIYVIMCVCVCVYSDPTKELNEAKPEWETYWFFKCFGRIDRMPKRIKWPKKKIWMKLNQHEKHTEFQMF